MAELVAVYGHLCGSFDFLVDDGVELDVLYGGFGAYCVVDGEGVSGC